MFRFVISVVCFICFASSVQADVVTILNTPDMSLEVDTSTNSTAPFTQTQFSVTWKVRENMWPINDVTDVLDVHPDGTFTRMISIFGITDRPSEAANLLPYTTEDFSFMGSMLSRSLSIISNNEGGDPTTTVYGNLSISPMVETSSVAFNLSRNPVFGNPTAEIFLGTLTFTGRLAPNTVPEPASAVLLASGSLLLLRRRYVRE